MHRHRVCVCVFLQDFQFDDWDDLCEKLNALATDCNKHRAKTDKRKQRSVFRDVLKAVEVGHRGPGGIPREMKAAASASALSTSVSLPPGGGFPVGDHPLRGGAHDD